MGSLAVRLAQMGEVAEAGRFPVLYLGRPRDSVVVEAYRHIVDPVEFDAPGDRETFLENVIPRVLVTCAVDVTNLLDLRTALGRADAGLTMQDLTAPTNDRQAYTRCQHVAQVAHPTPPPWSHSAGGDRHGRNARTVHGRAAGNPATEALP